MLKDSYETNLIYNRVFVICRIYFKHPFFKVEKEREENFGAEEDDPTGFDDDNDDGMFLIFSFVVVITNEIYSMVLSPHIFS